MGKLRILKAGPITTVQDFGRFSYRRYGIPQSGAMDKESMIAANRFVGNPEDHPVIEYAITGMTLTVEEATVVSVIGAPVTVNHKQVSSMIIDLKEGDLLEISGPFYNYAYLAIGGLLTAQKDFGSYSTYVRAGFGGIEGRVLRKGDVLMTKEEAVGSREVEVPSRGSEGLAEIRIMKGPEWGVLKELPSSKPFKIDPSSDRMGIRLAGEKLEANFREITSSAVVPGTIQLPPDGQPIVLMNDCQTTGGYPRIGKVLDEDLGRLAQIKPGKLILLTFI
ncbi:MAG: biotin-dependent carboxyltransferase family protein [Bacteroidota bacterium]